MQYFIIFFTLACLACVVWLQWCCEIKRYRLYVDQHGNRYNCSENVNGYPNLEQVGWRYRIKIVRGLGKGQVFFI